MYHVFESLPPKYQWIALVGLLIATLCVWLIQSRQDAALPPMSAPNSTLSLQFAWSSEGAKAIIDSWTAPQKKIASYQLYIDFLLLLFYPVLLSLSCMLVARYVSHPLAALGIVLSWTVLLAGPLDAIENIFILRMLSRGPSNLLCHLATISSAFKFALVFSVFGYWGLALMQWIWSLIREI